MIAIVERRSRHLIGRSLRKRFGIPERVLALFATSHDGHDEGWRRGSLLRDCRVAIADAGLTLQMAVADPAPIFKRSPVLSGITAAEALVNDENEADEDPYQWWAHDVLWVSGDGQTSLVSGVDPDGIDLSFYAWGERAEEVLETVRDCVARHSGG